jgi:hypothetical protein
VDGEKSHKRVQEAMVNEKRFCKRDIGMVSRYARDIFEMVGEIARVLKPSGKAVLVVGDCCIRSEFVSNSAGIEQAAAIHGLHLVSRLTRELPANSRYLPIATTSILANRLRTENVLTFHSS